MKAKLMNLLCVHGSWEWAKKMMLEGYIVRSTEFIGHLKFRANPHTKSLELDMAEHETDSQWRLAGMNLERDYYSEITTYEIFKWKSIHEIFYEYMGLKLQQN